MGELFDRMVQDRDKFMESGHGKMLRKACRNVNIDEELRLAFASGFAAGSKAMGDSIFKDMELITGVKP